MYGMIRGIQYLHEKLLTAQFDTNTFTPLQNFPGIKVWENNVALLLHFEHVVQVELNVTQLSQTAFFSLNPIVWTEQNPVQKLISRLDQLEKSFKVIQEITEQFQVTSQFDSITKLAIAASMLSMVNRNQMQLLDKENKKYKSFNNLAKRVPCEDVDMFVTAVNILISTGGNLAETFDTIVYVIRERIKVENKIQALTAQSYYQGMILMSIPPGLTAYFYFTEPEYMKPMFSNPLGWAMLFGASILLVLAYITIKKVVKIDI